MLNQKNQLLKKTRGRHNCNMIYLNQNLSSLDRRGVRENCNLFILFEQRGNVFHPLYKDFLNEVKVDYQDFAIITTKAWKEPDNYLVFDVSKHRIIIGELRINWDRNVF